MRGASVRVDQEAYTLPMQWLTDRAYLATCPAFHMTTGGQGLESSAMLRW
jgi:hypothetical protein